MYYNSVILQCYVEKDMEEKISATLESIQQAAMQEFLDKGFQGASLRQIVKNAGVTTGAFYGYFSSKEALFNALVEPHAAALWASSWRPRPPLPSCPRSSSHPTWGWNPDLFGLDGGLHLSAPEPVKLLLTRSEGTSYEHFVHNMVEVEVEYTLQYMEVLRRLGKDIPELDKSLCHIIASGCSMVSSRLWSTICPGSRPCGMWINSAISTLPDG